MSKAPSLQCLSYLRNVLSKSSSECIARRVSARHSCRFLSGSRTVPSRDVVEANSAAWNGVIRSLAKGKRAAAAEGIGRLRHHRSTMSMSTEEVQALSSRELFVLLRRCYQLKAFEDLIRLFDTYYPGTRPWRKTVWTPSLNFYVQSHIKLHKNDLLLDDLLTDFRLDPENSSYDSRTGNSLLHYLIVCKKPLEAYNLLEELQARGFPLDTVSYNTVLNGARAGSASERLLGKILKLMTDRNVARDTQTINIVVATFCQLGEYKKAQRYLADAVESGLANTITYNTVMNAELLRGNWSSAWSLLQNMREGKIHSDEASYTPFLRTLTQRKDLVLIPQLLDMISHDEISLSASTFNTILHALLFSEHYTQADQLLQLMETQGGTASEETYNTILHFYKGRRSSFLEDPFHSRLLQFIDQQAGTCPGVSGYRSVKLLQESQKQWRLQSSHNSDTLLTVSGLTQHPAYDLVAETEAIGSSMKQGHWQSALARYNTVVAQGVSPPMQMFVNTLVGLLNHRKYREARKISQEMNPKRLRSNLHFQTAMLSVITTQSVAEDIRENIRFLQSINVKLDIIFFSAAAWRLYRDSKFSDAVSLLSYAFGLGLAFDLVAWTILVECYAKTRNLTGAIWCLQTMKDNKILLDRQARRRIKRVVNTLESDTNMKDIATARRLCIDLGDSRVPTCHTKLRHGEAELLKHTRTTSADEEEEDEGIHITNSAYT